MIVISPEEEALVYKQRAREVMSKLRPVLKREPYHSWASVETAIVEVLAEQLERYS